MYGSAGDFACQTDKAVFKRLTDLSHLIEPNTATIPTDNYVDPSPLTQPETLIVPPDGAEVGPNIPTESNTHSKIPKWVIGVGIGLLLAVTGATAYFIWPGFGNTAITEAPIVEQSTQTPVAIPTSSIPTVTPTVPGGDAAASGFGSVDGNSSPSATPPTSAADLLRQRQQQQGL